MSNKRINKAYVRYDGTGRVIPSSLIISRLKPKVGNWKETPAYLCCNSIPTPTGPALRLLFSDINAANTLVGDVSNISNWNTFFDLPALGQAFTSVIVIGNEVYLIGGANIKVKPALMYNKQNLLIELDDQIGCITSVGGDAFAYSNSLTTVNLPECTILYGPEDSPENDYGVFGGCYNLINLNIPLLEEAGGYAFSGLTSLTSFNLPVLTNIGYFCFYGCSSLTTLSLPLVTTVTGNAPFLQCTSLTTISLPSLTVLAISMFQECTALASIDDIDCPALINPTSLPNSCFYGCSSLTEVNIPSLIAIDYSCFLGCSSLTTVNLQNLETVESSCFRYCTSLTTVNLPSCANLGPTVGDDVVFGNIIGNTITLTVPSALMTADAGNPDGDIQYLQTNNTVTIITT